MFYLAKWRINSAGQIIPPGAVFEAEFTQEQEKRLLALGAVVRTGEPVGVDAPDEEAPGIPLHELDAGADGGDLNEADRQKGEGVEAAEAPGNGAEHAEDTEDEDAEDEADEDAPVPVIDVSEGIVEAPAAADKPTRKKNSGRGRK